jgi:predicted glutamine amidotransferase
MCLISVKIIGVDLPKDEDLKEGESGNKDGIGIAYWKNNTKEVLIKKDFLDIDTFLTWLHLNIKKEDSCVIHFRYATHGLKDAGNRHPFPLTKNTELLRKTELVCQSAVAHNGIISEYNRHTKYSDTQKFVLDILSDETIKNSLESAGVKKLISNFIGFDRLAIITNVGKIHLWGEYEKEGDVYYSNSGYKRKSFFGRMYNTDYESVDNEPRFANSSIRKDWEGYKDTCEGCSENKFVRYVEVKKDDGTSVYKKLCKKCRKKGRKGELPLGVLEDKSAEECAYCQIQHPKENMNDYQQIRICDDCLTLVTSSLG